MTPTKRTLLKGLRDMAVMLALTALLYVSEQAANFGIPDEFIPIVSGGALLVYRALRDAFGQAPE